VEDDLEEQPTALVKEHDESFSFTTDVGRLFELGFNTGFLTAIQQRKAIESHFGDLYQKDLSRLRVPDLMAKM